jgi:hypothetical protein
VRLNENKNDAVGKAKMCLRSWKIAHFVRNQYWGGFVQRAIWSGEKKWVVVSGLLAVSGEVLQSSEGYTGQV